ncbi:LLM class flavin-dependent oxidoreductase [Mycobacterium shimoidei]|uniref:LLM class flavin-dependent oxidoreductase n=1 Tax=Mycobacterium shimoidei TaxID=29313 RepID=UPI000848A945|nr:LLM class flavin-dependent oxidoreductase [Mycobacterium shimoidei]MCV7260501.1 LLM class flavin-dependent oxidoreductase [Mycobacterium shimoidei]ODR12496.1 photosystem I reaction center subunit VIII [Mycobacterium shimoidei]ORW80840.1 photosystem I reaction center subunit VIII [Mycobacterium shimoidei]
MTGMRVGIMDGIIAARPSVDSLTRANYLGAVASRVDSFWVPDHLNSLFPRSLFQPKYCGGTKIIPALDAYLEPWTMLGHIAARNRIGRMRLGVGVTDAGRRNPAVTAQAAATLHLLTRGRAILGIGTGEREGNEPYGVDWSKPVARFEEAMATIRALWDSNGELVNRDSPYFPLRNALFDLPPYRGTWPQIWIAAHGPRMLRAVGRFGDGYFPASLQTPKEYAGRLEAVRTAASDAGRDPMSVVPAIWLPVITGRSAAEVDEALESEIVKAWALNAPDEFFAQYGAQHPLGVGFAGGQDILPHDWDEQTALSYIKGIPPALLRATLLVGTADEILDKAAQWRDCGVRYMVLAHVSFMQRSLRAGLASVAPFFKVVRGIKKL